MTGVYNCVYLYIGDPYIHNGVYIYISGIEWYHLCQIAVYIYNGCRHI